MIYIATLKASDYILKPLEILVLLLTAEILPSRVMKEIMNAKKEGLSYSQIAKKLNIPYKTISGIFLENKSDVHIISEFLSWSTPEEETLIPEEEPLMSRNKPQTDHPIDKLWAELEDIYLAELNKSIQK